MADEPKPPKVKKPMPEGVGEIPAFYVDTWYYNWWPTGLRLTFGERLSGKSYYRTAIMLDVPEIKRLIKGLQEVIDDIDGKKTIDPDEDDDE